MLFEGIEKKFELLVTPDHPSLRGFGRAFWEQVVRRSDARILSLMSNDACDAYLLSESSLFVYDRRAVMITCGQTSLVASIELILERVTIPKVMSLIYERKNENFPALQPRSFDDDVALLSRHIPGTSMCFGDPRGHHLRLFHLNRPFTPDPGDCTTEVLMYELDPEIRDLFFTRPEASEEFIRAKTGINRMLPGFVVNDHLFDPVGYSLNGIRDGNYYTVHVTPEEPGSYASFETNAPMGVPETREIIRRTVALFRPRRFDVILFQDEGDLGDLDTDYVLGEEERRLLTCGYRVHFSHFTLQQEQESAGSSPGSGSRSAS